MIDLNPFNNPDALWQHVLMLTVSMALGFFIGKISGDEKLKQLRHKLHKVKLQLEKYQ